MLTVAGGMQDWNYLHTNCFAITIELGCVKYPWQKDLKQYWTQNEAALFVFIAQVCLVSTGNNINKSVTVLR